MAGYSIRHLCDVDANTSHQDAGDHGMSPLVANKAQSNKKGITITLRVAQLRGLGSKAYQVFTNRMLDTLREAPQQRATTLSHQFKQDILFFVELLPIFNGLRIMGKRLLPYQHQVELDACLAGCGAVAGDQFYATLSPSTSSRRGIL